MVWDTCKIVLNSPPDGIFYTNNIVTGSVILEVKQDRKFGQIDLKVKGTSKAMWSRSSPTMPYIKIYSEKKEIFSVIIDIFGELKGSTLQPGTISRQFHFFLPPELPSSYNDSVAKVYYRIKIHTKNTYGLSKKNVCPFSVGNHVDLNHLNEYKIPMLYELTNKIGMSGHFNLLFKTYKGFTSKQFLSFEAIITNKRRIKVKKIEVFLIKKIHYEIKDGFDSAEETICKSVCSDVLNVVSQSCYLHMEIPQVMPSTTNIIDSMVIISYLLRVKVSFIFHFPSEMNIPVTIATVPFTYNS